MSSSCELCANPGGVVLWQGADYRIVRVVDAHYAGFYRVIWNAHVREMSDLAADRQWPLLRAVLAVEQAVRRHYAPDKINLASFGNVVPHLHWHIIARWQDDRHFPEPVWGSVQRPAAPRRADVSDAAMLATLRELLPEMAEEGA